MHDQLNKILSVTNSELDAIDMPMPDTQVWFAMQSGKEHYRLLSYISKLYTSRVLIDIGTYQGDSARALSMGKNKVMSYDVTERNLKHDGIEFIIGNVLDYPDVIMSAPFILLDTYHNGDFEAEFTYRLDCIGYKGLVMFDDIYLNDSMKEFWESIKCEKYDITHIGHHSGTGLAIWK